MLDLECTAYICAQFTVRLHRANALLAARISLCSEAVREGSPLYGRLDASKTALAGWSMGGGGAQRAAEREPAVRAVIAMCPHDIRPAGFKHHAPVLILAGQRDAIAPVSHHAMYQYRQYPDAQCKMYFEVRGGNHWIANDPRHADGDVGRVTLAWFKVHVEGQQTHFAGLDRLTSASRFETTLSVNLER